MNIIKPCRQVLFIWRLMLSLISLIPALLIFLFLKDTLKIVALAVWIILFLFLYLVYFPLFYKSLIYIIEDEMVVLKKGVFYDNYYSIPMSRIQFSSIIKSPFSRLFGLVTLRIVAPGARLSLSGLKLQQARDFSKRLLNSQREVASEQD